MNNKHILGEAGGVLLLVVEKDFAGEGQKVSHEPSPTGPVRAGGRLRPTIQPAFFREGRLIWRRCHMWHQ